MCNVLCKDVCGGYIFVAAVVRVNDLNFSFFFDCFVFLHFPFPKSRGTDPLKSDDISNLGRSNYFLKILFTLKLSHLRTQIFIGTKKILSTNDILKLP